MSNRRNWACWESTNWQVYCECCSEEWFDFDPGFEGFACSAVWTCLDGGENVVGAGRVADDETAVVAVVELSAVVEAVGRLALFVAPGKNIV